MKILYFKTPVEEKGTLEGTPEWVQETVRCWEPKPGQSSYDLLELGSLADPHLFVARYDYWDAPATALDDHEVFLYGVWYAYPSSIVEMAFVYNRSRDLEEAFDSGDKEKVIKILTQELVIADPETVDFEYGSLGGRKTITAILYPVVFSVMGNRLRGWEAEGQEARELLEWARNAVGVKADA